MIKLPTTTFQFIFHFVKKQWLMFGIFSVTCVLWAINDTFFPYFLKLIINTLSLHQGDRQMVYHALAPILLGLVSVWLATEICMRYQGFLQIKIFPQYRANMRLAVFDYIKQHSHEYFSSRFAGTLAKKLGDLPNSSQALLEIIFFQFVTTLSGATVVLVMMWLTKPIFAIIVFSWMCCHLGITALFLKYGNDLWAKHSDSQSALSGKIVDTFSNILNVRLFARAKYESTYLLPFQAEELRLAKKAMFVTEIMRVGLGISGLALIFSVVFVAIHGWIQGWISLGDFTQVGMQTFWLLGWIWYISYQLTIFARELGSVSDALMLIQHPHDIVDKTHAQPIVVKRGQIRFDNVIFGYNPKQTVFNGLNVTINAGEKVGLVGLSGSGKSTFVNLILRFYDLVGGSILIDNQNIANATQDSLRSQIAMIPQDPGLFHRTLMENIRYGRLDATDAEVIHAAKLAHCHEFIEKLPEAYDSLVGERGIKLSGGQRQRIAIARAMLKNAPILILDEATSALDSVTEQIIQRSLKTLMGNKTTLVVAHRLSTLADMDRILVFHQGKLVEQGNQQQLLAKNGHFATLWHKQTHGFLPEEEAMEAELAFG